MQNTTYFAQTLAVYKSYHQDTVNLYIHYICIPMIYATASAILSTIPTSSKFDYSFSLLIFYQSLYFLFAPTYFIGISLVIYMYFLRLVGLKIRFIQRHKYMIHVGCWVLQFIGHSSLFENRRPALIDNLVDSLLWAPAMVFVDFLKGVM